MIRIDFLEIGLLDFIDVLLVAVLFYFLYKLLKGTIAFNIFIGLASIYFVWWLVRLLDMKLLAAILGQFISVGVILILILFQQEIRKFLLLIGQSNVLVGNRISARNIFPWNWNLKRAIGLNYSEILKTCKELSSTKTGALIILPRVSELKIFAHSGTVLDAELSAKLLTSIFFKNNPLHDGAVIIVKNKIRSASCVLPLSENPKLPGNLGLRHRAGLGISEQSDALAIIISEEKGSISLAYNGQLTYNISLDELKDILERSFFDI
jgi:diadenylate cyclase